jgi:hypothetical protein
LTLGDMAMNTGMRLQKITFGEMREMAESGT